MTDWNQPLPLRIRRDPEEHESAYIVELDGVRIDRHLAYDGLQIHWGENDEIPGPSVVLKFGPDNAVDLDLDAELIGYLRKKDAEMHRPTRGARPIIVNHSRGCGPEINCDGC